MSQQKQKPASRPSVLSEDKIVDSDSDDDQQPQWSSVKVVEPPEIKMAADRKKRGALLKAQKLKAFVPKSISEVDSGEEETAEDEVSEEESDDGSHVSSSSGTKRPAPMKAAAPPR